MRRAHSSRVGERIRNGRRMAARAFFKMRLLWARRPLLRWLMDPFVRHGSPEHVVLITVAFNNAAAIEAQARLLAQNFADPYLHVVVDNSPDPAARRAIRDVCTRLSTEYLRLPRNPFTGRDPSFSHGEALNYSVSHMRRLDRSPAVGFLDHDVFPVARHSVLAILEGARAYGRRQNMTEGWYLWPGLCFFKRGAVDLADLDFRPLRGKGDTGARLYERDLKHWSASDVVFTKQGELELAKEQLPSIECHDGWAHTTSASGWRGKGTMQFDAIGALISLHFGGHEHRNPA